MKETTGWNLTIPAHTATILLPISSYMPDAAGFCLIDCGQRIVSDQDRNKGRAFMKKYYRNTDVGQRELAAISYLLDRLDHSYQDRILILNPENGLSIQTQKELVNALTKEYPTYTFAIGTDSPEILMGHCESALRLTSNWQRIIVE